MSSNDSEWILARKKTFATIEQLAPCNFTPYSNKEEQNNQVYSPAFSQLRETKKEFVLKMAYDIKSKLKVNLKCETDSYGSGYSSFFAFYFYRDEDVLIQGSTQVHYGLIFYISREVPAYIWAKHIASQPVLFMDTEMIEVIPNSFWEGSIQQIHEHLNTIGFKHIALAVLTQKAGFNAQLQSDMPFDNVYSKNHEDKVFDLLFHWAS